MHRYARTAFAVLGVGVLAIGGAWLYRAQSAPPTGAAGRGDDVAPTAAVHVDDLDAHPVTPALLQRRRDASAYQPVPHASTQQLPPMPAEDAPLAESADALLARARGGDGAAACRVLLEARACAEIQEKKQFAEGLAQSMAAGQFEGPDEVAIGMAAGMQEAHAAAAPACDGVDLSAIPGPDALLPAILKNLSPRQKLLLAMSRPDGSILRLPREMRSGMGGYSSTDYIVPQVFADHDLDFIQAGLDAADPLALEAALLLFAPGDPLLPMNHLRFSLPDPYRFALHARLMQGVLGDAAVGALVIDVLPKVLATLPAKRLQELEREVERELKRWQRKGSAAQLPSPDIRNPAALCSS